MQGLPSFLECMIDVGILQRKAGAIVYGRLVQSSHRSGHKHCAIDREVTVCIWHWENICTILRMRDELRYTSIKWSLPIALEISSGKKMRLREHVYC